VPEFAWNLRLEFGPWIRRIQTPEARVAALRELLDGASAEIRQAFRIEDDHTFTVPAAILSARPVWLQDRLVSRLRLCHENLRPEGCSEQLGHCPSGPANVWL